MKNSRPPQLGYNMVRTIGILLLFLAPPAFSDGPYEGECPPCKKWDDYEQRCVEIPDAPCWINATFGENANYDTCFQGNANITCVPKCGTIIETKTYICHKKFCPGYYFYEHDYKDVTYTWLEKECSIAYNAGNIARDLLECAGTAADCAITLAELAECLATEGATPCPDASSVASCLYGLADCLSRDPCRYFDGCKPGDIQLKGPTYKCTVYGDGCGT